MADELENHQDLKDRGYHIIGDDAYKTSHTLATPWAGKNSEPAKTCYNYYHSAARVTIDTDLAVDVDRAACVREFVDIVTVARNGA